MGTFVIFIFGVICTFCLVKLSDNKLNWISIVGATGAFLCLSYLSLTSDWRVSIANVFSMAALFFLPVSLVLLTHKMSSRITGIRYLVMVFGGLTAAFFRYVGFFVAFTLGVN